MNAPSPRARFTAPSLFALLVLVLALAAGPTVHADRVCRVDVTGESDRRGVVTPSKAAP